MESRRIVVSGRVQGVGYRYYILRIASNLNLKGYVRNLPNGRVEIEAEGEFTDIETLLDHCRVGPPRAAVSNISSHTQPWVGYNEFNVR